MRLLDMIRGTCASPHLPLGHQPGFSVVSVLQLHGSASTCQAPSSPLSRTLLLLLYFIDLDASLITPLVKYCFPGKAPWASPARSHPPIVGMWNSLLFTTRFRCSDYSLHIFSTKLQLPSEYTRGLSLLSVCTSETWRNGWHIGDAK